LCILNIYRNGLTVRHKLAERWEWQCWISLSIQKGEEKSAALLCGSRSCISSNQHDTVWFWPLQSVIRLDVTCCLYASGLRSGIEVPLEFGPFAVEFSDQKSSLAAHRTLKGVAVTDCCLTQADGRCYLPLKPWRRDRLQRTRSGSRQVVLAVVQPFKLPIAGLYSEPATFLRKGKTALAEHLLRASGNRRIGSSGFRQTASPMRSRETTEIQIRVAFAFMGAPGADADGQREAQTIHRWCSTRQLWRERDSQSCGDHIAIFPVGPGRVTRRRGGQLPHRGWRRTWPA